MQIQQLLSSSSSTVILNVIKFKHFLNQGRIMLKIMYWKPVFVSYLKLTRKEYLCLLWQKKTINCNVAALNGIGIGTYLGNSLSILSFWHLRIKDRPFSVVFFSQTFHNLVTPFWTLIFCPMLTEPIYLFSNRGIKEQSIYFVATHAIQFIHFFAFYVFDRNLPDFFEFHRTLE